jgi:hypothetical protein
MLRALPSTVFPIRHLLLILSSNAIVLLTEKALLNKIQINKNRWEEQKVAAYFDLSAI